MAGEVNSKSGTDAKELGDPAPLRDRLSLRAKGGDGALRSEKQFDEELRLALKDLGRVDVGVAEVDGKKVLVKLPRGFLGRRQETVELGPAAKVPEPQKTATPKDVEKQTAVNRTEVGDLQDMLGEIAGMVSPGRGSGGYEPKGKTEEERVRNRREHLEGLVEQIREVLWSEDAPKPDEPDWKQKFDTLKEEFVTFKEQSAGEREIHALVLRQKIFSEELLERHNIADENLALTIANIESFDWSKIKEHPQYGPDKVAREKKVALYMRLASSKDPAEQARGNALGEELKRDTLERNRWAHEIAQDEGPKQQYKPKL